MDKEFWPGSNNDYNINESLHDVPFPLLESLSNIQALPDGTYLIKEINIFTLLEMSGRSFDYSQINFFSLSKDVKARIRESSCDYLASRIGRFTLSDFPNVLFADISKLNIKGGKITDFVCYEIDGEEHRYPVNFGKPSNPEKEFIMTVFRDIIKDKLVAPIRIPTWVGDGSIQLRIVKAIMS